MHAVSPLCANLAKKIVESGLDRINKSVYLGTISESSLTRLENEWVNLSLKWANTMSVASRNKVNGIFLLQQRVVEKQADIFVTQINL